MVEWIASVGRLRSQIKASIAFRMVHRDPRLSIEARSTFQSQPRSAGRMFTHNRFYRLQTPLRDCSQRRRNYGPQGQGRDLSWQRHSPVHPTDQDRRQRSRPLLLDIRGHRVGGASESHIRRIYQSPEHSRLRTRGFRGAVYSKLSWRAVQWKVHSVSLPLQGPPALDWSGPERTPRSR